MPRQEWKISIAGELTRGLIFDLSVCSQRDEKCLYSISSTTTFCIHPMAFNDLLTKSTIDCNLKVVFLFLVFFGGRVDG